MTVDISTMTQAELLALPTGPGRRRKREATATDRERHGAHILWVEWYEVEPDTTRRELGWIMDGSGFPWAIMERADGSLYRM